MLYKIIAYVLLCFGAQVFAATKQADIVIVETTIVAGKQAPKFLSIVPWRLRKNMTLDKQQIGLETKPVTALEPEEFEQMLNLLKKKP